jgi:hypothetical protein
MPWVLGEPQAYHGLRDRPTMQLRFVKQEKHQEACIPQVLKAPASDEYLVGDKCNFHSSTPAAAGGGFKPPASRIYKPSLCFRPTSSHSNPMHHEDRQPPNNSSSAHTQEQQQQQNVNSNLHKQVKMVDACGMKRANAPMGEIFRLPMVPSGSLLLPLAAANGLERGGGNQKACFVTAQTPRYPVSSPRLDFETLVDPCNNGVGRKSMAQLLTPRTQKEADMAVARLAQKKNMIAQHIKRLQNKDWASRKAAVDSLALLVAADPSVMNHIMALLESKSDKSRQTAVWAISRIVSKGDPHTVDLLIQRLESPLLDVRMAAVSALESIAVKGAAVAVQGVVARILHHSDWSVREAAVDSLQHVADKGDMYALEGLTRCVCHDTDWRVRQVAIESIFPLLDRSLVSVKSALECCTAVCKAPDECNEKASAPRMLVSQYRNIMSCMGVPHTIGMCKSCRAKISRDKENDTQFQCIACVSGMRTWVQTALFQQHALAFAMGGHERLGAGSWVRELDSELIPIILEYAKM